MIKLAKYSGSGNVLIKMEGSSEWLPVCDDSIDSIDSIEYERGLNVAKVVCRSLGFKKVLSFAGSSHYGEAESDEFALDNVSCNGTEASLADCTYETEHNCSKSECWGVTCK